MRIVGFRHATFRRMTYLREHYDLLPDDQKEYYHILLKMYNKRLLKAINHGGRKMFRKDYVCIKFKPCYL